MGGKEDDEKIKELNAQYINACVRLWSLCVTLGIVAVLGICASIGLLIWGSVTAAIRPKRSGLAAGFSTAAQAWEQTERAPFCQKILAFPFLVVNVTVQGNDGAGVIQFEPSVADVVVVTNASDSWMPDDMWTLYPYEPCYMSVTVTLMLDGPLSYSPDSDATISVTLARNDSISDPIVIEASAFLSRLLTANEMSQCRNFGGRWTAAGLPSGHNCEWRYRLTRLCSTVSFIGSPDPMIAANGIGACLSVFPYGVSDSETLSSSYGYYSWLEDRTFANSTYSFRLSLRSPVDPFVVFADLSKGFFDFDTLIARFDDGSLGFTLFGVLLGVGVFLAVVSVLLLLLIRCLTKWMKKQMKKKVKELEDQ